VKKVVLEAGVGSLGGNSEEIMGMKSEMDGPCATATTLLIDITKHSRANHSMSLPKTMGVIGGRLMRAAVER
jgi:hypothetical protein